MKIAIDGPAGSGKSSVAKAIAKAHGALFLDTGAMYRALTYTVLAAYPDFDGSKEIDASFAERIVDLAKKTTIELKAQDGENLVLVDGRDVTQEIRSAAVDAAVSRVAGIQEVRAHLIELQKKLGSTRDVVAEGRDTTTVVFPDAEVKIYLSASPEARALRRAKQRSMSETPDKALVDEIEAQIIERDRLDIQDNKALVQAKDAHVIDSTELSFDEVVAAVEKIITETKARTSKPKPAAKTADDFSDQMKAFHSNSYDAYFDHPLDLHPWPARLWRSFVFFVLNIVTKLLWPWTIEGLENLPRDTQLGSVIIMNHTSTLDPIPMAITTNKLGRKLRAVYKSEFDKVGIVTWLYSRVGAFPVERGTADMKALRRSVRSLKHGEDLLIYPEGTRVKRDEDAVVHGGFTLMAQMAKAKVVPVAIVGARDIKPKGAIFPRFGRVYIKIGKPISFEELGETNKKAALKKMETVAMEAVYALRAELRQKHPGKM